MTETAFGAWLVRTAVGGGLLLLLCWLWQRRQKEPARQQRLGEGAVAAALLVAVMALFPAWWRIPVPGPSAASAPAVAELVEGLAIDLAEQKVVEPAPDAPVAATPVAAPEWRTADVVLVGYVVGAAAILGHWLLANLAVWWLLRDRRRVPTELAALFAEMAWPRRARLIVSDRVQVPFSVGLFRPTVVLPQGLVHEATTEELRWVLAHELTHLARQDTRTCWLFALGQVVFFYLPWFWWLRRRVRLSQEYIADAAAVEWAGSPADYAQFLVSWARAKGSGMRSAHTPAAVTGVTGSGSDLFRRVTMMLESKQPCETRCSRTWGLGLASGLVALGLVMGGVGLRAVAAEDTKPEPKKESKKEESKQDAKPKERKFRQAQVDLDKLFEALGLNLDEDALKEARQQIEEARKRMEKLQEQLGRGGQFQFPGGAFGLPNPMARRPHQVRLGVQVSVPSKTLADQLDLPKDQGLVLEEVGPNSAAGKAGLKSHDVLLELNGKPVPNRYDALVKLVDEIKPNTPVDAVVLRKGKKETVKGVTLPEAKPVARNALPGLAGLPILPRLGGLGGNNRGVSTSISRSNDEFTTKHREDGVSITIKGTIDQGKAKVSEVVIDEGKGQSATYDSVDKVPTTHKEKVQRLAEMSAKGSVRAPLDKQ